MKILFVPRSRDATAFYRVEIPAKYLQKAGHEVRINFFQEPSGQRGFLKKDLDWSEVLIFQRPVTEEEFRIIAAVKNEFPGKLVMGDYDDDYDNVPSWNPGYVYLTAHSTEWRMPLAVYDGVIVSTEPLKELCEKYANGPVFVIKNGMDLDLMDSSPKLEDHYVEKPVIEDDETVKPEKKISMAEFNEMTKDKIVVGWFGSRSHYCDIDWLPEQIGEVMESDPDVYCCFIGYANWRFVNQLPEDRFWMAPGIAPVSNYYRLLKSIKMDISFAPVDPVEFNRSKSGIKIYESMLSGIFPIASEFDTYEDDIHEGLLAGYEYGDWVKAIKKAISIKRNQPEEWQRRLQSNDKWVRDNHYAGLRTKQYEEVISQVFKKKYPERI